MQLLWRASRALVSKVVENASGIASGEHEATAARAAKAETRVNCMMMLIRLKYCLEEGLEDASECSQCQRVDPTYMYPAIVGYHRTKPLV